MDKKDTKNKHSSLTAAIIISSFFTSLLSYIPIFSKSEESYVKYTSDVLIITLILVLSIGLFFISSKLKNKLLIRLIAIFIFFHFFFFPMLYVYSLNNYPSSFEIDNQIYNSEKKEEINFVKQKYGSNIDEKKTIIDDILNNEKSILEKKISEIDFNKIYTLKNYYLIKNYRNDEISRDGSTAIPILNIYNKDLVYLNFVDISEELLNVKKNLEKEKKIIIEKSLNKRNELNLIQKNKFWSFKKVLPYSINIFFTDNLKPKNKFSNLIYFIHNFFIFIIVLSLIIGFIQNNISEKTQSQQQ